MHLLIPSALGLLSIQVHALLASGSGASRDGRLRGARLRLARADGAHLLLDDEIAHALLDPGRRAAAELVVARLDAALVLEVSMCGEVMACGSTGKV